MTFLEVWRSGKRFKREKDPGYFTKEEATELFSLKEVLDDEWELEPGSKKKAFAYIDDAMTLRFVTGPMNHTILNNMLHHRWIRVSQLDQEI